MVGSQSLAAACCLNLVALLGEKVSFPGTAAYNASLGSYFSQQASSASPLCIVSIGTAQDVATALSSLTDASAYRNDTQAQACPFAVRSGGHMSFSTAANVDGGVTIDLRSLNSISLSQGNSSMSVGPGATWDAVYSRLDPLGLSVVGGRAAGVGVGGLTLGGGISYFSPRYGWACDNAYNFEAVLANGSIVQANAQENPDLLLALRGGSNNFGIVTRVDLKTFPQGLMWGGNMYHPIARSTVDVQLREFVKINSATEYDEYASLIASFAFSSVQGLVSVSQMVYTKPAENPAIFQDLMSLPKLASTMRLTNMSGLAQETAALQPPGLRESYAVATLLSTVPVLNATVATFNASIPAIQNIPGIVWGITFEPLPPAIYARHGGANALGLSDRTEALVVCLFTATWLRAADDDAVNQATQALVAAVEDNARALGGLDPYKYLNYAAPWQRVIENYGEESVRKLQKVRRRVDPRNVFTYGVPGGFKIPT